MAHNRRMATNEEWITTAECAQRSGYHRTHIVDIIKREPGIRSKRFGRAWMVEWNSFETWLKGLTDKKDARFGPQEDVDKSIN
jgi:hypothetical protein